MIRQRASGGLVLIPQAEHAALAAQLVGVVGGTFSPPCNAAGMTKAAAIHESGYQAIDRRPMLSATGKPVHFTELPLMAMVRAWAASAEAAEAAGPYPGMLVSLLMLQRSAALPATSRTMREAFEINKLQHLEIERQERLRPGLGLRNEVPMRYGLPESVVQLTEAEKYLLYDYRLLLLLSQLTLEICGRARAFGDLASTPRHPGGEMLPVGMRWAESNRLIVDPWPFAHDELELRWAGRLIPPQNYEHEKELQEAMEAARTLEMSVLLVAKDR